MSPTDARVALLTTSEKSIAILAPCRNWSACRKVTSITSWTTTASSAAQVSLYIRYFNKSGHELILLGTSESVGSCPGSNPENTSGSRVCSCVGPASGVDTCSSGQSLSDSGSSNSTSDDSGSGDSSGTGGGGRNGSSSGSGSGSGGGSSGSSGSSQNGATHIGDLFTVWGSAIVFFVSFIVLVTDL